MERARGAANLRRGGRANAPSISVKPNCDAAEIPATSEVQGGRQAQAPPLGHSAESLQMARQIRRTHRSRQRLQCHAKATMQLFKDPDSDDPSQDRRAEPDPSSRCESTREQGRPRLQRKPQ
eukprot:5500833-Pyramimonas_sp.AAC.1